MDAYEKLWWSLPQSTRATLERAVTAIVYDRCGGNRAAVLALVAQALDSMIDVYPVAAAVLWRLRQEVEQDG